MPAVYTGQANLTTLSSAVTTGTGTGSSGSLFQIVYHCQNCLRWNQSGEAGSVSTTGTGATVLGRAAAKAGPTNAGCPDAIRFGFHDHGYGQFAAPLAGVTSARYEAWAALPAKPVSPAAGCAVAGAVAGAGTAAYGEGLGDGS